MIPLVHKSCRAWLAVIAIAAPATAQAPLLEAAAIGTTEGHARLVWEGSAEGGAEFELEVATTASFDAAELVYRGPDRASFRSGLPAGTHWFRLRERSAPDGSWSPWSASVPVEVAPYDLSVAWSLFGVGGFLVAAIIGYLVIAGGRSRTQEGNA